MFGQERKALSPYTIAGSPTRAVGWSASHRLDEADRLHLGIQSSQAFIEIVACPRQFQGPAWCSQVESSAGDPPTADRRGLSDDQDAASFGFLMGGLADGMDSAVGRAATSLSPASIDRLGQGIKSIRTKGGWHPQLRSSFLMYLMPSGSHSASIARLSRCSMASGSSGSHGTQPMPGTSLAYQPNSMHSATPG